MKVSIIVPTTRDREEYNQATLLHIKEQDYHDFEFLFDYGEGTIGAKRNRLCEIATGEIILHMDSDDKYKPDWVSKSVLALIDNNADIVGLKRFNLYDPQLNDAYEYSNNSSRFVAGATMCYRRSFWERNKFDENRKVGEDSIFLMSAVPAAKVFAHDYKDRFLASIHHGNTCKRNVNNETNFRKLTPVELLSLKEKWLQ